jgi:hypothetical protein
LKRVGIQSHLFDDGQNMVVGVSPEQFGFRPFPARPEQRLVPIVKAMKEDRQQQP